MELYGEILMTILATILVGALVALVVMAIWSIWRDSNPKPKN